MAGTRVALMMTVSQLPVLGAKKPKVASFNSTFRNPVQIPTDYELTGFPVFP
jgi:hypothetical protein